MARIYHVISDYYPSPAYANQLSTALKEAGPLLNSLPGIKIMNQNPRDLNDLFNKFVTYIHGPNGFRWNGSAGGATGHPLLDNNKKEGECAMFARAFMILAIAPKPYGLGLNKTDFELASYSGPNKKGFVSNHPVTGVVGLMPNVTGQALYFWMNHKVVKYQNRYYDVMYNVTYNSLKDMTAYAVSEGEVTIDGAVYHPTESTAVVATLGRAGTWFKEQPLTRYAGPSVHMPF
jgi:hypothetical protein